MHMSFVCGWHRAVILWAPLCICYEQLSCRAGFSALLTPLPEILYGCFPAAPPRVQQLPCAPAASCLQRLLVMSPDRTKCSSGLHITFPWEHCCIVGITKNCGGSLFELREGKGLLTHIVSSWKAQDLLISWWNLELCRTSGLDRLHFLVSMKPRVRNVDAINSCIKVIRTKSFRPVFLFHFYIKY